MSSLFRRAAAGVLVALGAACAAPASTAPDAGPAAPDAGPLVHELPPPATIGGARPAKVVVPATYDGVQPLPAVFILGGYDNLASDLDGWIEVSKQVDPLGFVLVMPDGLIDSAGSPYWNATDTCCDYDGTGVDDAGYLEGLRTELLQRFAVDPDRVALLGHSAGGFMAYHLACDGSSRWSAVASLAGSMWLDLGRCAADHPVSVVQVHGSADDIMPFAGDDEAPGALAVLKRWASLDGCTGTLAAEPDKREYIDDTRDHETTVSRTGGCPAGVDLELWKIAGSDHYPAFRTAFTEDVLRWLLAHPRPAN
jgi:polyhydroxybutyrate depolymerase